ncbi:uncharacterized protein LOC109410537 [Aedes albopictus]|uniref:Secreted protein n=1 Tax=Aedes albopictus TaxID=7160 RepID=A0ABM2A4A7_AEDAL|nr:uncharacterized protein LOC109410537 [Aedes albopictus]KXJ71072.1 hypothetical protein RP20_CCG021590 [Aedes albopictus]
MKIHLLPCIACLLVLSFVEGRSLRFKRSDIVFRPDQEQTWEERELAMRRGYSQSSAANTGSQTIVGPGGIAQQTAGGSVSSNLANDGSSGQLSAANTQQQSLQSGDRLQSQNSGQSQSANFGKDHQQMSNANTNTNTVQEGGNIRQQTQGGAGSSVVDKFGSQASQAQTTNERYVADGQQGSRSTGSSNSQNIGKDGSGSTANSNTGVETIVLPDGTTITKSFGSSSSFQSSRNVKVGASASGHSNAMQG